MNKERYRKQEFSQLIEKNQGIIHKVSLLYTHNKSDKEDLFQEICLQLWRSYKTFNSESKFSTWMYRVALNTSISYLRKKPKNIHFEGLNTNYLASEDTQEKDQQSQLLFLAISKLKKLDKAIIILWLEGKKYEDIGQILGLSKSNISVRLVRIKRNLEESINQIKNK